VLANELKAFNKDLPKKKSIIAITKLDIADEDRRKKVKKLKFPRGVVVQYISAATSEGILDLVEAMWKLVSKGK
jgi:GTP-binding protein